MVKKKKHKNVRKLQKMYFDNVVTMNWQNIMKVQKKRNTMKYKSTKRATITLRC